MGLKMKNRPSAEFNSSSISDIVFLLLIYFLLTSTFVTQVGIKVDLPQSKSTKSSASPNSVTITAAGAYAWNNSLIDQADLPVLIQDALEAAPDDKRTITLRVDQEVTMRDVAFVMAEVQQYKGRIVFATRKSR